MKAWWLKYDWVIHSCTTGANLLLIALGGSWINVAAASFCGAFLLNSLSMRAVGLDIYK